MQTNAYEINEDGFIVERHLIEVDEDGIPIDEEYKDFVTIQLPQPNFYRPRWNSEIWVEDKAKSEFDEEEYLQSLIPSAAEIANAELEIKILTILMEVGIL